MKKVQRVLALLLCGVLLFLFAGCSPAALASQLLKKKKHSAAEWSYWTDANGNAYAVSADGKAAKLTDSIDAIVLPGGKKALVINEDEDTLFLLNMKSGEKTKLYTTEKGELEYEDDFVSENFVMLYEESDNESDNGEILHFYDLKHGKSIVSLSDDDEDISLALAYNPYTEEITVAYTHNNAIYTYKEGDKEAEKLLSLTADKESYLRYVSQDGKTVVYAEADKNDTLTYYTVKIQYGDTQTKICTVSPGENASYGFISVDGNADGKLYLINKGKVDATINLGDMSSIYYSVYTDKCAFRYVSSNVNGVYLQANNAVYYCDFDGEKIKVVSDVKNFIIQNNIMYYIKTKGEDSSLYAAKIKKGELTDEVKVGGNVTSLGTISDNGKYIYYTNKDSTLYAYKFGEDSARRLATKVSDYMISAKGDQAVFLSDGEALSGTYSSLYTLQRYDFKKDTCTKIAEDVRAWLITGMEYGYIDPESFVYQEYAGKDKDGQLLWDLKYYNGKKSKTVLQSVQ